MISSYKKKTFNIKEFGLEMQAERYSSLGGTIKDAGGDSINNSRSLMQLYYDELSSGLYTKRYPYQKCPQGCIYI